MTLYGTTTEWGAHNFGTVFSITPGGDETVLYSFQGGSDGATPEAGLIDVGGTLYGTTYSGGTYGYGTVFAITPGGTETLLHSFARGAADGANPSATLISADKGVLYGTTVSGGARGTGTILGSRWGA